ncbi:MAG TPA: hypothetical protein VGJ90_02950 [Methylophilaceae bacterium]|jgi:hypothetical protein
MRLDFNLVLVDDDLSDEEDREDIDKLLKKIDASISRKGFELRSNCYASIVDAQANTNAHHRVDLFLSDNNLGNNENNIDASLNNGGIDYYLNLRKQPYLCDFVLYTRAGENEIIDKLATNLKTTNNPNLFTRFTFVNRDETDKWHKPIIDLLNHILTKREELNNLRGLYAQRVSMMDLHLKKSFPRNHKDGLKQAINKIPKKFISSQSTKLVHEVREIRNGLMHNDESFCQKKNQYVIRFTGDDRSKIYEIYEDDLQQYREKLNTTYLLIMSLP